MKVKVGIILEKVSIQASRLAEFGALGELLAHKEELLAGMAVLIGIQEAEIGELLPHVAGHFVEKGIFAVDDFVVGEGQHEVFGESVEQGKGELVLVKLPVTAVGGVISQCV